MNIRIKHKNEFSKLDQLIERYYEGLTTGKEEKQILNFLSQPDLPKRFDVEKRFSGILIRKRKNLILEFCHTFAGQPPLQ